MTRSTLRLVLCVAGAAALGVFWGVLIDRLVWPDNGARPGDPSWSGAEPDEPAVTEPAGLFV